MTAVTVFYEVEFEDRQELYRIALKCEVSFEPETRMEPSAADFTIDSIEEYAIRQSSFLRPPKWGEVNTSQIDFIDTWFDEMPTHDYDRIEEMAWEKYNEMIWNEKKERYL